MVEKGGERIYRRRENRFLLTGWKAKEKKTGWGSLTVLGKVDDPGD